MTPLPHREFLVVCLCAEWCDVCRDYRAGFQALEREFPNARFLWVDVEDNASLLEDFDVEDFPTILIQRDESVLFYGPMLPHHSHLRRTLEAFRAQTSEQSRDYAQGNDERRGWQGRYNFMRILSGSDLLENNSDSP